MTWKPGCGPLSGTSCCLCHQCRSCPPVANKGSLNQYVGRILRSHENKTTAEVHDYLDERTGVLAAMLAKHAPGYTGLGFLRPAQACTHSKRQHRPLTAPLDHIISH